MHNVAFKVVLLCTDQVCVKCTHTLTRSLPGQRARAVPSAGSVGSRPAAASCPLENTHTHKAHTQTDNRGHRSGVKGQGAWFQPPGRCDATEAPGGTRLCMCVCVCVCMYIYECMCMFGAGGHWKWGEGCLMSMAKSDTVHLG